MVYWNNTVVQRRDRPKYRSTDIIGRYLTFWISAEMRILPIFWCACLQHSLNHIHL